MGMLAGGIILLALSGCVPSLHPLYETADLQFDTALTGTWQDPEGEKWVLLGAPNKAYSLDLTEDGDTRRFEVHLLAIGNERYIDLYPAEPDLKNSFYEGHLLRVHHFARIRQKGDVLEAAMLDDAWLKQQFDKGRFEVAREKLGKDYLLTGKPAQLRAFLAGLAGEKAAFAEPQVFRRAH